MKDNRLTITIPIPEAIARQLLPLAKPMLAAGDGAAILMQPLNGEFRCTFVTPAEANSISFLLSGKPCTTPPIQEE